MPDATVTFNFADAIGSAYDPARTKFWLEFNTSEGWVIDADGKVRAGAGIATVDSAGLVTVAGIPIPSASTNPTSFQVRINYDAPPRAAQQRNVKRERGSFGWFTVTASAALDDLVEEQFVPPTYLSTVTAQLDAIVDEAEAAQAAAEAAAAAAVDISNIDTSDGVVSTLIEGTAGAGPLTRSALSASTAESIGGDRYATGDDPEAALAKQIGARTIRPRLDVPDDLPFYFNKPGTVLVTEAQTGLGSIYWPQLIDVRGKIGSPLGNFYLIYSTDHSIASGGIGLAYADHPEGPWTVHTPGTPVYVDTVAGNQTETPVAVWNDALDLWDVYYSQDAGSQSTLLARTADFITWTRVGVVIQNPATGMPGNGHTGYFIPHREGGRTWGYHLLGGGDYGRNAISYSDDGQNFVTDPRPLSCEADLTGDNDLRWNWHNALVFSINGERWIVALVTPFDSGLIIGGAITIKTARLAPTFRTVVGKPIDITPALSAGETQDSDVGTAPFIEFEGKLYGAYRANGQQGDIRLVTLERR